MVVQSYNTYIYEKLDDNKSCLRILCGLEMVKKLSEVYSGITENKYLIVPM